MDTEDSVVKAWGGAGVWVEEAQGGRNWRSGICNTIIINNRKFERERKKQVWKHGLQRQTIFIIREECSYCNIYLKQIYDEKEKGTKRTIGTYFWEEGHLLKKSLWQVLQEVFQSIISLEDDSSMCVIAPGDLSVNHGGEVKDSDTDVLTLYRPRLKSVLVT